MKRTWLWRYVRFILRAGFSYERLAILQARLRAYQMNGQEMQIRAIFEIYEPEEAPQGFLIYMKNGLTIWAPHRLFLREGNHVCVQYRQEVRKNLERQYKRRTRFLPQAYLAPYPLSCDLPKELTSFRI